MTKNGGGGYIPQIWWPQISGSWKMPKMGGPEKGGFQDHQNRAYFQDPEKTAFFGGLKKRPPKKGPKKGRFLGPGK